MVTMIRTPVQKYSDPPRRLGRLTATEQRIWRAFPRGELVDLRSGDARLDDPAQADEWTADRVVRGEVLAALLLGACPAEPGGVGAVRIAGARITGGLAVDHGQVSASLLLQYCRFEGPVELDEATTGSIDLSGSHLSTLSAYGAHVRGTLDLRDAVVKGTAVLAVHADGIVVDGSLHAGGIDVTGSLCLINAVISGQVTLNKAKLINPFPHGKSLNAGGIRVGRSLLAQNLEAVGEIRLPGAHIGSALVLDGAQLTGSDGSAFQGEDLSVASSVFFRRDKPRGSVRFTARGRIRLVGARIGGGLHFSGARLEQIEPPPASEEQAEEQAEELEEEPEAALEPVTPPTSAPPAPGPLRRGAVRLRRLLRATWDGTEPETWPEPAAAPARPGPQEQPSEQPVLAGSRMVIEGSLYFGSGFSTEGELQLTGSRITGHLDLREMASPEALLTLYAVTAVGGIRDDPQAWPGRVNLDGFSYGAFDQYLDARGRLPLLQRMVKRDDPGRIGAYRAQPYEQLASYYRGLGSDGEARTVLLAKQRALRRRLPRWQRVPGHVLDLLVGYGYRPLRAIGWALGLLVAGSVYFSQVEPQHVSSEDHSLFNPVLFAADHLIPVIRFGQPEVWQYHGVAAVVTVVLTVLGWTLGIAIAAAATRTLTRG